MAHTTDQANVTHALDSLYRSAQDSNVHVVTCTCGLSAERPSLAVAQLWWNAHDHLPATS